MKNLVLISVVLLALSCQRDDRPSDDQLRGSTPADLWNTATPQLRYKFCLQDKISVMADRAKTAAAPRDLEDAYLPFTRSVDECLTLVPSDAQWAEPIGEAVKIRVRETLGEIAADYLSEMELVQGGHRDRATAIESWQMWAMAGIREADAAIPE